MTAVVIGFALATILVGMLLIWADPPSPSKKGDKPFKCCRYPNVKYWPLRCGGENMYCRNCGKEWQEGVPEGKVKGVDY